MLSCEQFRQLGELVLEGEGHPDAYVHLDGCPRCRRLIRDLSAIAQAARTLPALSPPPELWNRLESAALEEGLWRPSGWWRGWELLVPLPLRPALAGGLVVALAALLTLVGDPIDGFTAAERTTPTAYEVAQSELVHAPSFGFRYQVHLNHVETTLLQEADAVDVEARQLATRPLNTLDRAIGQTQLHLAEYPDDSLAREELLRLYRQKATALQAMSDIAWQNVSY